MTPISMLALALLSLSSNSSAPHKPSCNTPFRDARVLRAVSPTYPATVNKWPATNVIVEITIGTDGRVRAARIFKSSHNSAIDQSAVASARQTTYHPKIIACKPTERDYLYSAEFPATGVAEVVTLKPPNRWVKQVPPADTDRQHHTIGEWTPTHVAGSDVNINLASDAFPGPITLEQFVSLGLANLRKAGVDIVTSRPQTLCGKPGWYVISSIPIDGSVMVVHQVFTIGATN
jgi:TonB family protein